jgi:hypothetical protein
MVQQPHRCDKLVVGLRFLPVQSLKRADLVQVLLLLLTGAMANSL